MKEGKGWKRVKFDGEEVKNEKNNVLGSDEEVNREDTKKDLERERDENSSDEDSDSEEELDNAEEVVYSNDDENGPEGEEANKSSLVKVPVSERMQHLDNERRELKEKQVKRKQEMVGGIVRMDVKMKKKEKERLKNVKDLEGVSEQELLRNVPKSNFTKTKTASSTLLNSFYKTQARKEVTVKQFKASSQYKAWEADRSRKDNEVESRKQQKRTVKKTQGNNKAKQQKGKRDEKQHFKEKEGGGEKGKGVEKESEEEVKIKTKEDGNGKRYDLISLFVYVYV
jgi:hypothetical protein